MSGTYNSSSVIFKLPKDFILVCNIVDSTSQIGNGVINTFLSLAQGCMVVYDKTNLSSFKACNDYCKQVILENCKNDIKVMLVGTKTDLFIKQKIPEKEGLKFAQENDYLFRETSCLDLNSVKEAFETLIIETFNSIKNKYDLI